MAYIRVYYPDGETIVVTESEAKIIRASSQGSTLVFEPILGGGMDDVAYNAGRLAYDHGIPLLDNPYPELSGDWHDWQRGYCDAEEQAGW